MSAVELAPGAEKNAFASMMATLIRQNLDDHPSRDKAIKAAKGRASIEVTDLGIDVTFVFDRERVVVYDGVRGIPDVRLRAPAEVVMATSNMEPGPFGLPDPRGETNRKVWEALREGRLEIVGALRSPLLFAALGRLLAVR
ncbi:MAG: SCP2 sterol-binding domain-containing protein [Myxococcales bacterium]|jgi:hypothetical protein|nr:SCP2 sterol-binding domain-containing protein [Myxococcales bacterium]